MYVACIIPFSQLGAFFFFLNTHTTTHSASQRQSPPLQHIINNSATDGPVGQLVEHLKKFELTSQLTRTLPVLVFTLTLLTLACVKNHDL
jgi:hypothetical protein